MKMKLSNSGPLSEVRRAKFHRATFVARSAGKFAVPGAWFNTLGLWEFV